MHFVFAIPKGLTFHRELQRATIVGNAPAIQVMQFETVQTTQEPFDVCGSQQMQSSRIRFEDFAAVRRRAKFLVGAH